MSASYEQVLEDPRSVRLPAGFEWSRRLVGDDPVGKWCLMYDSKFVCVVSPPPPEGWTRQVIDLHVSKLRLTIEEHTTRVQLKMLNGPMAGRA